MFVSGERVVPCEDIVGHRHESVNDAKLQLSEVQSINSGWERRSIEYICI